MIRAATLFIGKCASAGLLVLGFIYGQNIRFSEQWPLFEALRNTAAIIFAVIGAWAAIIYPERLKLAFEENGKVAKTSSSKGIEMLMAPIFHSTFLLAIILLVGILAPIVKQFEFVSKWTNLFRGFFSSFFQCSHYGRFSLLLKHYFPQRRFYRHPNGKISIKKSKVAWERLNDHLTTQLLIK